MLKGLIPVLLTPMKKNFILDEDGMFNLINYLIESKVGGLWALGSASEEINIGMQQKVQAARLIGEINDQRIPVIMGTGAVSYSDHMNFLDQVSDIKFDGIHVLPFDLKMGKSRTINLYEKIADESPYPVWMYHNPKRGRAFELDTIKHLSEHSNIGGIKIGGYNLSELTRCFMLKNDNFDVVAAGSGQVYQMMCMGAEAHTTSEGSILPKLFQKIIDLYNEGKHEDSWSLQQKWILLNAQIPRTDNGEHSAEEKYMLSLLNICEEWVNPNYVTLDKITKETVLRIFNEMQKL